MAREDFFDNINSVISDWKNTGFTFNPKTYVPGLDDTNLTYGNANIDYQKMRGDNPELVNKSYIFFGDISKMSYEDFKMDKVNYLEDLKSQIYVNSKIASNKFLNYNKSLYWFKFLLCVSIMLFISIMIMR